MESLHQRLGNQAEEDDMADLSADGMTQYNPYEDESQNVDTFPMLDEEPEVTYKWGGPILKCNIINLERGQDGPRLSCT